MIFFAKNPDFPTLVGNIASLTFAALFVVGIFADMIAQLIVNRKNAPDPSQSYKD
jgi:hypothetical protein